MSRYFPGICVIIFAAVLAMPVFAGEPENKPEEKQAEEKAGENEKISWKTSWDETKKAAEKDSRNIILLFTNPERCPPCRMMENLTWPDPDVTAYVNANYVPLMIITGLPESRAISKEFKFRGIPTTFIVDTDKNVIAKKVGFLPAKEFLAFLKAAASQKDFEKAAKEKPDDVVVLTDLAKCRLDLGKDDEAKKLFEKVLEIDPENKKGKKPFALLNLGEIILADARQRRKPPLPEDRKNALLKEAEEKFQEVIKLDPEGKENCKDKAAFNLAFMTLLKNDYKNALEQLAKYIKDFPESDEVPGAIFWTAYIYSRLKDFDKAISAHERLLKEFPKSKHSANSTKIIQFLKRFKKEHAEKEAEKETGKETGKKAEKDSKKDENAEKNK